MEENINEVVLEEPVLVDEVLELEAVSESGESADVVLTEEVKELIPEIRDEAFYDSFTENPVYVGAFLLIALLIGYFGYKAFKKRK